MSAHRCSECGRITPNGNGGLTQSEFMAFVVNVPEPKAPTPELAQALEALEVAEIGWRLAEEQHLDALRLRNRLDLRSSMDEPAATDEDIAEADLLVGVAGRARGRADVVLGAARLRANDLQRRLSWERSMADYEATMVREGVPADDLPSISGRLAQLRKRTRRR